MKTFLFLATALFVSINMCAQGNNLQFNRVVTITGNVTNYSESSPHIVPEGKVWKVESYASPGGITINNTSSQTATSITGFNMPCPIWLKAGDFIKAVCWTITGGSGGYIFSIIEYNIVP
jgi:hypothetical protein